MPLPTCGNGYSLDFPVWPLDETTFVEEPNEAAEPDTTNSEQDWFGSGGLIEASEHKKGRDAVERHVQYGSFTKTRWESPQRYKQRWQDRVTEQQAEAEHEAWLKLLPPQEAEAARQEASAWHLPRLHGICSEIMSEASDE